jgi:hypothetical protein
MQSYKTQVYMKRKDLNKIKEIVTSELDVGTYQIEFTFHAIERVVERKIPNLFILNCIAEIILNKNNLIKFSKHKMLSFMTRGVVFAFDTEKIESQTKLKLTTVYELDEGKTNAQIPIFNIDYNMKYSLTNI